MPNQALAEIESRMGIEPLDALHAERAKIVKQAAELRAKHGPFGTYDALRKLEWSRIATIIRAQAVLDQVKMTEAAIEQAAHADSRYIDFITNATLEKAQLSILEDRIQAIGDVILRANAIARYLAAEAHLS